MARTPIDDPTESRQRGIGSLPAAVQFATFLPVDRRSDQRLEFIPAGSDTPVSSAADEALDRDLAEFRRLYEQDPQLAFEQFGWYTGPEFGYVPMREISDYNASLTPLALQALAEGDSTPRSLYEILDHPELFAEVPELRDITVVFDPLMEPDHLGSYNPFENIATLNANRSPEELLSTILHEAAGHAVQDQYGLPSGGNWLSATGLRAEAFDRASRELAGEQPPPWDGPRPGFGGWGETDFVIPVSSQIELLEESYIPLAREHLDNTLDYMEQDRERLARDQARYEDAVSRGSGDMYLQVLRDSVDWRQGLLASSQRLVDRARQGLLEREAELEDLVQYTLSPMRPENPRFVTEENRSIYEDPQRVTLDDIHDWYQHLPGEAAARLVQSRSDLSPEQQRDVFPGSMLDTDQPLLDEIYRLFEMGISPYYRRR